jgi:hypothetical protein
VDDDDTDVDILHVERNGVMILSVVSSPYKLRTAELLHVPRSKMVTAGLL